MKRIVLTAMIAGFAVAVVSAQKTSETKPVKSTTITEQKQKTDPQSANLTTEQKIKIKAQHQSAEELQKDGVPKEKLQAAKSANEQNAEVKNKEQVNKTEIVRENETPVTPENRIRSVNNKEELTAQIKAIQQDETLTKDQKTQKTKELVVSQKQGTVKSTPEAEPGKEKKKTVPEKANN